MATKSLGRVSIVPQGDYDENQVYERLDLVKHDGKTYLSLKEDNTGLLADEDSWMLLTESGRFEDLTPQELETILQPLNEATDAANQATDAANQAAENALLGIKDVATTATVPSPTGFERWLVHEEGTYTNFGSIVVTAADLDVVNGVANNRVILEVSEGVATKRVERIKGDAVVANPVFNSENNTEAATMKATADYMDRIDISNTQTVGSTDYDIPFSFIDFEMFYLNNDPFNSDKYITSIKSFANSAGVVNIVFGSVVDGKFVERKQFSFTNTTNGVKTYAINDILFKGEIYGIKTPSNGMAWKNVSGDLGKLASSTYGASLDYDKTNSLAFELNISDFEKNGYTKYSEFSALLAKVDQNTYEIAVGSELESGSTTYNTPVGAISEQGYHFNDEAFNEDRYISKIEMHSVSAGNAFFAFGSVVNGKFIERVNFSFSAGGNKINVYNLNAILLKGECIALKTPSVGLTLRTGLVTSGKLAQTTGYSGEVTYDPNADLALKITSHTDYTESGSAPISLVKGLSNRINNINDVLKKIDNTAVITVGKNSGDFNTIKDAVDSFKLKTGKFIVHILPGVYEEMINLFNINNGLDLSFIGTSKKDVTILMRLGDYHQAPMQVHINSYFENITFKSTQELGLADPPSYAVHSDFGGSPALIEYFNCDFVNEVLTQAAYGAGSWQGHTLRFRNCVFNKKNTSNSGSLFWHNQVQNNIFNQRLEVLFCEFYADGGATLTLNDANQTSSGNTNPALSEASVLFVGNTFKSGNLSANASFERNETLRQAGALVGNIYLDEASHGNNITDLNF